jgi:hypothetical protein
MKAPRLAVLAGLAVLVVGPALLAEPPASSSAGTPDVQRKQDELRERSRQRRMVLPTASVLPPLPWDLAAPSGSRAVPLPSALPVPSAGGVHDELRRKWRLLAESRQERRERHRAALVRELGQRLSDPQIKAELKLHATRVAELSRLKFLADNARSGAARDKLLARIDKLSALEIQRHRKRLAKLTNALAAPSASGATRAPVPSVGGQQ